MTTSGGWRDSEEVRAARAALRLASTRSDSDLFVDDALDALCSAVWASAVRTEQYARDGRCSHGRYVQWMTAQNRGMVPLPDIKPCWIHLDDSSVCVGGCSCACNADFVRVERWECRIGCGLLITEDEIEHHECSAALRAFLLSRGAGGEDTARLDWLQAHPHDIVAPMYVPEFGGLSQWVVTSDSLGGQGGIEAPSLREAIDRARSPSGPPQETP